MRGHKAELGCQGLALFRDDGSLGSPRERPIGPSSCQLREFLRQVQGGPIRGACLAAMRLDQAQINEQKISIPLPVVLTVNAEASRR